MHFFFNSDYRSIRLDVYVNDEVSEVQIAELEDNLLSGKSIHLTVF